MATEPASKQALCQWDAVVVDDARAEREGRLIAIDGHAAAAAAASAASTLNIRSQRRHTHLSSDISHTCY